MEAAVTARWIGAGRDEAEARRLEDCIRNGQRMRWGRDRMFVWQQTSDTCLLVDPYRQEGGDVLTMTEAGWQEMLRALHGAGLNEA